jgi:mannose-6-phosphate isomerase-like protein (cupin superfamily)
MSAQAEREPIAEAPYTFKRLAEMERAFGGAFVRVRAELGISAFGVQVVELPPSSGALAPEHDHLHNGQEELYVLLDGSAEVVLPDGAFPLDRDTLVRIAPETRRRVRSGPDGARLLMVGGRPGAAYEPPANTEIGGPEVPDCPTASSAIAPDGPSAQLEY